MFPVCCEAHPRRRDTLSSNHMRMEKTYQRIMAIGLQTSLTRSNYLMDASSIHNPSFEL